MIAIAFAESIMQMGKLPLFAKGVLDERHYTVDQKWCLERKKVRSSRKNTHIINPPTTNQPPLDRRALIRGIARPAVLRRERGGHCTDGMAGP